MRQRGKTRLLILVLLFCSVYGVEAKTYTLFDKGKSNYNIVLSKEATASEVYSAKELQHWLYKICGITLPIVNENQGCIGKRIIVGYNQDAKGIYPNPAVLSTDAYEYLNHGGDIIIRGDQRGVIYGVYAFLKKEFGCRWYTKDFSIIPQKTKYSFSNLYETETPAFDYRQVFYYEARDYSWKLRNGINQINAYPPAIPKPITGGSYFFCGSHTFNLFVPVEKYYDAHPEYFSLIKGKRHSGKAQLCLSNPDVLKLCTDGVLKQIEQYPDYYAYSLSQNDCYRPCECSECKKLLEKYGTQSGVLIWFVNQVADVVKKKYPDKYLCTYAYQYTEEAPKNIKPRDNVIIELCDIDDCCIHRWDECEENADFLKAIKDWTAISSNVYVFDYVSNYMEYLLPVPNFHVYKSKLQLCKELECRGVRAYGVNMVPNGEFAPLKNYVLAQLIWNPDQDVDALVDEFITAYYGSASQYVKDYYDLLQSAVKSNIHMHNDDSFNHAMYDSQLIRQMNRILGRAYAAARTTDERNRVEALQMSPAYLTCRQSPSTGKKDGSYELIHRIIDRDKLTRLGEGVSLDKFEEAMNNETSQQSNETSLWNSFVSFLSRIFSN